MESRVKEKSGLEFNIQKTKIMAFGPRYSHLFQKLPQFIVIHTGKGFGIVNKAEIDFFFSGTLLLF